MFKKPLANQSNATPIRSSARRQLVAALLEQYPAFSGSKGKGKAPENAADDAAEGGRADDDALSEKELARVILPEGIKSGTFETSGGVDGTVYSSPDGDPLWMTFGRNSKEYIPTLSLLSIPLPHPPLPILQIYHPLPPPLLTGAPLFVGAVRNLARPWMIPDVSQGGVVAFVASQDNGTEVSYVGVGRVVAKGGVRGSVELRIKHLNEKTDVDEGRFCEILCILGDHLWENSLKPKLPTFALPQPDKPLEAPSLIEAGPSRPPSPATQTAQAIEQLNVADDAGSDSGKTFGQLDASEISTLLSVALLQALSHLERTSLPMPASLLYSAYVLPNRPAYIPREQRQDVIIAKSEWKKLAKWMKEVSKEGLLKIKEAKGEIVVQSVDTSHPSLQSHAPFTTIAEEETKAVKRAAKAAESAESGIAGASSGIKQGKGKETVIEELWKPSGAAASFWEAAGIDKSHLHAPSALKTALDDYISKHLLIDQKEHRFIVLDEALGRAVGVKRPQPGERMAKEDVMRKLRAGVSWSVSVDGVVRKGSLQPITMSVKTRQGRKTVTFVTGLESFGTDIDEFAEELRKLCAGSASVQPLQGASPKLQLSEIMVQGSQVKAITDALLARGIPKRWIKEGEGDKKK